MPENHLSDLDCKWIRQGKPKIKTSKTNGKNTINQKSKTNGQTSNQWSIIGFGRFEKAPGTKEQLDSLLRKHPVPLLGGPNIDGFIKGTSTRMRYTTSKSKLRSEHRMNHAHWGDATGPLCHGRPIPCSFAGLARASRNFKSTTKMVFLKSLKCRNSESEKSTPIGSSS